MGQYWKLVNIDKRQELFRNNIVKLLEMIDNLTFQPLVGLLRTPQWIDFCASTEGVGNSKRKCGSNPLSPCPLIGLPQEIIDRITSCLFHQDKHEDVICLSLTCSYFFRVLGTRIQALLKQDVAPWSGDRLILIGDYAETYPPGMAFDTEGVESDKHEIGMLYDLPDTKLSERKPSSVYMESDEDHVIITGRLLFRVRERISSWIADTRALEFLVQSLQRYPSNERSAKVAAVLRNLTTKEYIVDDAIASIKFACSVGEVLALFAMWTDDPSGTAGLGCHGEWAGHRFDIASREDVTDEMWTDRTEDALSLLRRVSDDDEIEIRGRRILE